MTTKSPTSPESYGETFVAAGDGTPLYLRTRDAIGGPKKLTALLCDGLVCDGFIYKYIWDDVAPLASVAHWHYRGHGRSGKPRDPERIGIVDHAADLNAVRAHLGDPPVVLFGHSMGTQVIFEAYRRQPENVAGLVLLCGSFGRVTHTFKNSDLLATVLPKVLDFVVEHPKIARALWSRVPVGVALRVAFLIGDIDPKSVSPEDVAPYFRHAAHVDFEMFLKMLRDAGEHSAADLLTSVNVPVLVVAGDHDSFTPPELSLAMVDHLPRAELMTIPGGTHVAPLEHHSLLAARLEKFVSGLETS